MTSRDKGFFSSSKPPKISPKSKSFRFRNCANVNLTSYPVDIPNVEIQDEEHPKGNWRLYLATRSRSRKN
jgi:hypothetical protein